MRARDGLLDPGVEPLEETEEQEGARDLQQHQDGATSFAPYADPNEWQVLHITNSGAGILMDG
jgi:hypothetical protein